MEKNNIENYEVEKNTEEPNEIIDSENEPSIENNLEELNADFEAVEQNYQEIINHPESSQAEKVTASIWRARGKSLLVNGLALLTLSTPLKAADRNNNVSDFDQSKNETTVDLSEPAELSPELEKYKEFGPFMAYNLASEKPTDYQAEQIKKLEDGIIADLNGKQFASMTEMIAYINNSISSDFSEQESTIYIKDAFPEGPATEAKGSFDCDTRVLISLSILHKLGISADQAEFCLLEGHALLRIKEDNVFFEMTTNDTRELSEEEKLQLNKIDSFDKYKAYLLSKEGTALASEATANIFRGERDDQDKIGLALNKMIMAAELDPNNLTNNLNLLTLLKKINRPSSNEGSAFSKLVEKTSENIQRALLNNYYDINHDGVADKILILRPQEINNQKIEPRSLEDLGSVKDLTAQAVGESDYLARKFIDLGGRLFDDFQNPKAALPIFEALAKGEHDHGEKNKLSDYCFYKQEIASCYFNLHQYDQYLDLAENELYNLLLSSMKEDSKAGLYFERSFYQENLKISAANVMTGRIIINEETVEDFCKKYQHDPLFSGFISGKQQWNASAIEAVEALRVWPGFEDMIKTLDDWRAKQALQE